MDRKKTKAVFRRIVITVISLLFISAAGATFYYLNNKKELVEQLVSHYNENFPGTLTYDDVVFKHWAKFPKTALGFRNLSLVDTSSLKKIRFNAEEMDFYLSLGSIWKKKIQIKSIHIKKAELNLDDYSPLTEDEISGQIKRSDTLLNLRKLVDRFFKDETEFNIEGFQLNITNEAKNKFFGLHFNKLISVGEFGRNDVHSQTEMDVNVQALGFNLAKGTFGNNARLIGTFNSEFDLDNSLWHIDPFDLQIDDQVFMVNADFVLKKQTQFSIVIDNEQALLKPSVKLLSRNIAEKLQQLDLDRPIDARISLNGHFVYKGNPVVVVDFSTQDNLLKISDSIPFDLYSMKGKFINRFYDDKRADTEDLKNFRIFLDDFKAGYHGLNFEMVDFLAGTGPESENQIHTKINAGGSPTQFNHLFNNQYLSFDQGDFDINLLIEGDLASPAELLGKSSGSVRISNTQVTNNNNKVSLKLNTLSASISKNQAEIEALEIPLNNRDQISIIGHISNVAGLFTKSDRKSMHSDLELRSRNVDWNDILMIYDLARSGNSSDKKPQDLLRESLIAVYRDYNPSIKVYLENFHFRDLHMRNFSTGISYDNQHLLRLNETSFEIRDGKIVINAALDLENRNFVGLSGDLSGSGNVEFLDKIFQKEVFAMQGGQFELKADINGDAMKVKEVLGESVINLLIRDTEFVYKPENLHIPVRKIDLDLSKNSADLNSLLIRVGDNEEMEFSGNLQNMSSLLFYPDRGDVSSSINLYSKQLHWNNFLSMFQIEKSVTESTISKSESKKRLKKTLQDIYLSVNPELNVDIEKFVYGDIMTFRDIEGGLRFGDENTLVLDNGHIKFGNNGEANLSASLDLSQEASTSIKAELLATGDPDDLGLLFNESNFGLEGGSFELTASVEGDVQRIDKLIAGSDSHLVVRNSSFLHHPSGASIPTKIMDVGLRDNNALLNNFTVGLPSGRELKFSGEMRNASSLFLKEASDSPAIQSDLLVESEDLIFDEFVDFFELETRNTDTGQSPIALKHALKDFYRRYQPSLRFDIKSFTYDELPLKNLTSGFHFENENQFYLESTAFDFYEGHVELDAHLDLTDAHKTPFAFAFNTEALDLAKLLDSFDYFGLEGIQKADKIAGNVTLHSELQGNIVDSTGIDTNTLKGKIDFEVKELQLIGFDPLIEVAKKVFKKERFQDIRFRTIKDTLYLSENILEIPLTEIQSTAIQLFVAGHLGFEDAPTNMWTAIPLSNLKSRDLVHLPDKKGYIESGRNVYVEAKTHKDGSIKYVLHLNPKKYYQERGMLDNYREEIKEYRYQRRQFKRESRRADRKGSNSESDPGSN